MGERRVRVGPGTDSPEAHRQLARTIAQAIPDSRYIELADCGHVTYAEQPDEFARALRSFAEEIDTNRHQRGTTRPHAVSPIGTPGR